MAIAWAEMGQHEIAGAADNPRILDYFRIVGHAEVHHDETPWCAAFVGACLESCGIASTKALNARSYEMFGVPCRAVPGAIGILPRGVNPSQGHVGFVAGVGADGSVALLGGNQGDQVSIAHFPVSRFLAFRWPPGTVPPSPDSAPAAPLPVKMLVASSRKLTLIERIKDFFGVTAIGSLLSSAMPSPVPADPASLLGYAQQVLAMARDHGAAALIGVCVVVYALLHLPALWAQQDNAAGRYTPSGADTSAEG